ncbi:MAG: glycosyltransferase family 4 protein [Planctomycetota bacterium]
MEKHKIITTGFVSADAGSVASANAVLLRGLLDRGHEVTFYTKPSFVDPRPALNGQADTGRFRLVDCTNQWGDGLRRRMAPSGKRIWGHAWGQLDAKTYNQGLVRAMRHESEAGLDLWLGDWARGRGRRSVVSYAQGPPGTDARSVFTRRKLIQRLSGHATWLKLAAAARWRLGPGLPRFRHSDHVIVGSEWSRRCMTDNYRAAEDKTHALPYPIDLNAFQTSVESRPPTDPLRLFWLGRFAPRKRLDLFLDGLEIAIREGCDAEAWVVGSSAFAPGFDRLLEGFPYPERLRHWPRVPREEVPKMLADVDVMAQPSDEENFGSSVAEALACGVPAIVGATNGTGDYICENSIRLVDDQPETFARAVVDLADRKRRGELADRGVCRAAAEKWFAPDRVLDRFIEILELAKNR